MEQARFRGFFMAVMEMLVDIRRTRTAEHKMRLIRSWLQRPRKPIRLGEVTVRWSVVYPRWFFIRLQRARDTCATFQADIQRGDAVPLLLAEAPRGEPDAEAARLVLDNVAEWNDAEARRRRRAVRTILRAYRRVRWNPHTAFGRRQIMSLFPAA